MISDAEIENQINENPLYLLMRNNGLTPREIQEVRFAQHYAHEFLHGTDGHSRLVVIAKLAYALNKVKDTIGVHGHMLTCPACNEQLSSLLLCFKCGTRYQLTPIVSPSSNG